MKILTRKKQRELMCLLIEAQRKANEKDWFEVTMRLSAIAYEILTDDQCIAMKGASFR